MGKRSGGKFWVLVAFAILGYWVYGQTSRPDRSTKRVATEANDEVAVEVPPAGVPSNNTEVAIERDERVRGAAIEPESPSLSATVTTNSTMAGSDCVLSTGPFALPDGTKSVDWKIVNRSDRDVDLEVTVYRLRIGDAAEVVSPGKVRATLPSGHETHNANSVGQDKPFTSGPDYEVVVRRNGNGALPSVSFWSTRGNSEIPGTRIGPRDFVAVSGNCTRTE